jgi:hypothetical protein
MPSKPPARINNQAQRFPSNYGPRLQVKNHHDDDDDDGSPQNSGTDSPGSYSHAQRRDPHRGRNHNCKFSFPHDCVVFGVCRKRKKAMNLFTHKFWSLTSQTTIQVRKALLLVCNLGYLTLC